MKAIVLAWSLLLCVSFTSAKDAPSAHDLIITIISTNNELIPLANRMIAQFKQAQTWEGVNPDHSDAVALRTKIAKEKEVFLNKAHEAGATQEKLSVKDMMQTCTSEERKRFVRSVKETSAVMDEWQTQFERYHALGY